MIKSQNDSGFVYSVIVYESMNDDDRGYRVGTFSSHDKAIKALNEFEISSKFVCYGHIQSGQKWILNRQMNREEWGTFCSYNGEKAGRDDIEVGYYVYGEDEDYLAYIIKKSSKRSAK